MNDKILMANRFLKKGIEQSLGILVLMTHILTIPFFENEIVSTIYPLPLNMTQK